MSDPSGAAIAKAAVTANGHQHRHQPRHRDQRKRHLCVPGSAHRHLRAEDFRGRDSRRKIGPDLTLLTGQVIDLPIALAVGAQTQQITVTSETQQIETSISTVEQSVTQQQMRDLPLNGRNPLQLTTLTAGTVLTTTGTESGQEDNTGLSVNGLRATENTYTLDGTIYVNRFFDSVPTMPNPDALQEFTIQSSNYSADHAGAGALVQLSTRSGTDRAARRGVGILPQHGGQRTQLFLAGNQCRIRPSSSTSSAAPSAGRFSRARRHSSSSRRKTCSSARRLHQSPPNTPPRPSLPATFPLSWRKGIALYNPATGCGFGQTATANGRAVTPAAAPSPTMFLPQTQARTPSPLTRSRRR